MPNLSCARPVLMRQPDIRKPEIVDALHEGYEILQLHGLLEEAIRMEFIASQNIRLRIGAG